ncbi:MAG: MGMT family protein [Haloarculaceae archaeon]
MFKFRSHDRTSMDGDAGIYARESTYLDRFVQVGVAQGRVISVSFPPEPAAEAQAEHPLLDRIDTYLQGTKEDFSEVTVALTVPTDRREVLEAVRTIPYGQQATVDEVARMTPGLDSEESEDRVLVREVLADNPAPLFVPDHRVRDGPSAAPASVEQRLRAVEGL